MIAACIDCGQERQIHARQACGPCYERYRRTGTLHFLPPAQRRGEPVDEAVVERILGGDWKMRALPPERTEVCRRWFRSGRTLNELAKLTGWAPHRYFKIGR